MNGPRHDPRGGRAGTAPRREPRRVVGRAGLVGAAAVALLGLLSSLPGCGIGFTASSAGTPAGFADEDAGINVDAGVPASKDATKGSTVPVEPVDGGTSDVLTTNGRSPLCGGPTAGGGIDGGTVVACDPDAKMCVPPPIAVADDGGGAAFDAGAATLAYGCHVTATHAEAGAAQSAATCSAAGEGTAETPCYGSASCAPGFECVVDTLKAHADGAASGGGVCRHYCCDDSCPGDDTFCHIESTVSGAVSVPVCVSAHVAAAAEDAGTACELLNDSTCSNGLTCQVVNQFTGQVACVAPGGATAGESCEMSNCAEGLSCVLGYFPARECAQLCYLQNDNCPAGETCTASAAISGAAAQIGTCSP